MSKSIEPFDFLLIRVPGLPTDIIRQVNASPDFRSFSDKLRSLLTSYPEINEAIMLSNLELYRSYTAWMKHDAEIGSKLILTLYRYIARMSTRPTPFGKFSGVFFCDAVAERTALILDGSKEYFTRLDMGYVASNLKNITDDREFLQDIRFFCNNSVHECKDHYRYAESMYQNGKRHYLWVRINKNPLLQKVYDLSKNGRRLRELANDMTSLGLPSFRVDEYLHTLIDRQFLVSELEPSVTGNDYLPLLAAKLERSSGAGRLLSSLIDAVEDKSVAGVSAIDKAMAISGNASDIPANHILQTDQKTIAESARVNRKLLNTISREIEELFSIFHTNLPDDLRLFAERFRDRYDMMEVPLLEALDGDTGVGYGNLSGQYLDGNPLINKLDLSNSGGLESFALEDRVMTSTFGAKGYEIDLEAIGLANLRQGKDSIPPPTFYTFGTILARDGEELDNGRFQFHLKGCGGPSAKNLIARFSYMDERLREKLVECTQYEEHAFNDAILAEIIHIPEDRIGNILQRPIFHSYEIPFLGRSTVDEEHKLYPSDLLISVRNGKVILRSRRLDKRVIPRLSCAHNFRKGISIYRFLCDLQHQDYPFSLRWNWGRHQSLPFLPRVTYKHLILSRARWHVSRKDMKNSARDTEDMDEIKSTLNLPSEVLLAEGDNELFLNLDTPWGARLFLDKLKKGNVTLYEVLADDSGVVRDQAGGRYANEWVIPFKSRSKSHDPLSTGDEDIRITRDFPPGSEWVYIKLYCGQKIADEVLRQQVSPLVRKLADLNLISKWFFIRYRDPDFHIRLRLHIKARVTGAVAEAFRIIHKWFNQTDREGVWKMQYDTYSREIERYGAENIELCESIFHSDSLSVLEILTSLKRHGEEVRWKVALFGVNQLFDILDVTIEEKWRAVESWYLSFKREFGVNKIQEKTLNQQYRENRSQIDAILFGLHKDTAIFKDIFDERYLSIKELLGRHLPYSRNELSRLWGSLSHMFLNRIFYSDQRANEMVVYHYLAKSYTSRIAINKVKD